MPTLHNIYKQSNEITKLSNLAKSVDSNPGIQANTVSVTKIVDEYRDIERRKWNVIVFNVPEPKSADTSQRKTEDREFLSLLWKI